MPPKLFITTDLGLIFHFAAYPDSPLTLVSIKLIGPKRREFSFRPLAEAEDIARDYAFLKERIKERMVREAPDEQI